MLLYLWCITSFCSVPPHHACLLFAILPACPKFFFNLTITAIGTGTSFNLSQLWSVLYWLIVKGVVTEEAMSQRKLERQRVPADYIFGRFAAEHIYILMISMVYSAIVPIVLGACSVYFFVASKIYTHQCLYVFSQKYEGGGKVFYSINRVVFVIIYASIIIFATVMLLKEMFVLAGIFLFGMIAITYMVDTEIKRRFSKTSRKLPLTRARIIDEEYENLLENEEQIVEEASARNILEPGSPRLDMPASFAGTDRRKMLTKQATAARKYNASVGMGMSSGRLHLWPIRGGTHLHSHDLDGLLRHCSYRFGSL